MGFWLKHIKKMHLSNKCPIQKCISSRRQQEKVMKREQEIITLAHELADEEGFAGLTIDKIVKRASCSKGTIYNHFSSKEDLITALSIRALSLVIELFKKALTYPGNSREKVIAISFAYNLYSQLEPTLFMCCLSSKTPSVIEKTSPERYAQMIQKEMEMTQLCDQVTQAGIDDSSLVLPKNMDVADYTFAMWAMSFGTNSLLINIKESVSIDRLSPNDIVLKNISILLDGMKWRPLTDEFDYSKTWGKLEDFFSEYISLLCEAESDN